MRTKDRVTWRCRKCKHLIILDVKPFAKITRKGTRPHRAQRVLL